MLAEQAANEAKFATSLSRFLMGLNIGVNGGLAIYHWNNDQKFRAATDVMSITGVPFNMIPDFLNAELDIFKGGATIMFMSQGGMAGAQNSWTKYAQPTTSSQRF